MSAVGTALLVTAFAVVASGCRDTRDTGAAEPPPVELKASVAPFAPVPVQAPVDGTVVELNVREGALVRRGDVLATLTNPAVERDLAHAEASVLAAEQRLRSLATSPNPTRSQAERLNAAAGRVRRKKTRVDRMTALLASGDIARQELENAEEELDAAQRDFDAERERGIAPNVQSDRALLQAELERALADRKLAERRRLQLVIRAPATGNIARLQLTAEGEVYARSTVADIVDSSTALVQAQIAPELLRLVQVGRPVDLKLMTIPARRFREPISQVQPPGPAGPASIAVRIPNPDRMLQPGTPAVITIR